MIAPLYFTFIQFFFVGSALLVQNPSFTTSRAKQSDHAKEKDLVFVGHFRNTVPDTQHGGPCGGRPSQDRSSSALSCIPTPDVEQEGSSVEEEVDSIDMDKNNKYILGLIDNLTTALDKYILTGSKTAVTQAQNILVTIESLAENEKLVLRARRMFQRAGIVLPSSSPSTSAGQVEGSMGNAAMNGDASDRKREAEERLKWEESRKEVATPVTPSKDSSFTQEGGRSALSRRAMANGKPDFLMGQVMNQSLEKITSSSNDKKELEKALSSSIEASAVQQPEDNATSEEAADKVAELVARAGAASSFKGESLGIGGLDDVLAEVKRRVWTPLAAPPRLLDELGICPVRGLLLYGKPGNGKTLLARKLGQILSPLRPVTVVSGPEVMDKFVGSSEKNLREIFDHPPDIYDSFRIGEKDGGASIANAALHVVVMDEFDAIARRRGGRGGTGGDQSDAGVARDSVVNQLLAKMDGVDPLCVPTLVIGLTNKRSLIDPALLRPGRFEVQVEVPPPRTTEQRVSILKVHTHNMHQANRLSLSAGKNGESDKDCTTPEVSYDEMLQTLAEKCDGFSGASLAGLSRAAASRALERAVEDSMTMEAANGDTLGSSSRLLRECMVTVADFEAAIEDIRSGMGDSDHSIEDEEETEEKESSKSEDSDVGTDSEEEVGDSSGGE